MSTNNDSTQHVQIAVADPTPLGLFGLAVVTMVASAQKLGIVEGVSWVLPWALFCGSFAQLLAGYFDYCHRNIFGATIFSAFGFFWSAVGMSWMIGTIAASSASLFLFVDMVFIDILLLGLALDGLGIGGHFPHTMAAYAEMAVAIISLYGAGAGFLNNFYGRQFWPVGAPLGIWKK